MKLEKRKALIRKIARERIDILYDIALQMVNQESSLSKRYTRLIRRIGEHYKIPLPKNIKNSICKGCGLLMVPGLNSSVKIASVNRYVIYKCAECKKEKHIRY